MNRDETDKTPESGVLAIFRDSACMLRELDRSRLTPAHALFDSTTRYTERRIRDPRKRSRLHIRQYQRLRSSTTSALVAPRTVRATIGDRTFPAAAASVWNSLPESVYAHRRHCKFFAAD